MKRIDLPGGHLAYTEAGSGELVVLLHAGYVDHTMWEREITHLARRCKVVAPDARTHGCSSTATAPFRHCDDVAALVRHLDAGPAILVGISMGASAALETAIEHPDCVRGVVISGAGTGEPSFEDPWSLKLLGRLERAIAEMDPPAWIEAELEFAAGPRRNLAAMDPGIVARLRVMHEHFASTHVVVPGVTPPTPVAESWSRLGMVTVPVLGIVGEEDSADHHRMTRRAVTAVRDGRGVATIAGAGHYPNLERPEQWAQIVDAFLADLGIPRPADESA
ncbi:alpha/beta fold hydrolase [Nocardioides sp. dk4132]|uniref:alpha/beta fold hydrolase n=1 Tax=unclassified Nocardioides TaxID=2615069 RepID=UPI0012964333|nr:MULTISPECIES: alpha/beta hydrolase [unclassified Nocardioides]MQW78006.1 alpha/beta fold hydrolase [Nocardioides sp. dk4132]QGA08114.1 alpha/beta fold hydrolase [Nocardioides sp. dk884]